MITARIQTQLGDFSLDVDLACGGRVVGLFGPSGCGKTTLLHCVAGILAPARGRIALNGDTWLDRAAGVDVPVPLRRVGYVFQEALLFPHMCARDNVLYGHRRGAAGPRFEQVVDVLHLGPLLDRQPGTLSGGEQRRVAIARALMRAPALLLLDEPLTGLDAAMAGRVLVHLREILDTFNIPAIYVSHAPSDVVYLCDEAVVLRDGRVTAVGPPSEVVIRRGALTRRHLADLRNVFRLPVEAVDAERESVCCALGGATLTVYGAPAVAGQSATLAIRASDIVLAAERPARISARNVLPARVQRVEPVGGRVIVFVDVGAVWMVEVGGVAVEELAIAPGRDVFAVVKASAIEIL